MLLLLASPAAKADLYRWVDPQSGSVKLSSVPPPASQPGVEVVPYRGRAAPPKPAASSAAPLELRWRELLAEISVAPASSGASPQLQQRVQDFVALTSELEQLDPAGASRRRGEAQNVLQRLFRAPR